MKFSDFLNEGSIHKVTKKEFNAPKFQKWIKDDLGETKAKGPLTMYFNKAGKEVFSYNERSERLMIIQNGLKIDQLVMYGLPVGTVVPMIESESESELNEYAKSSGYQNTEKSIYALEKSLNPTSNLAKGIMKDLGDGYKDDFAKMSKHMSEIISIWEEISMDIEQDNS